MIAYELLSCIYILTYTQLPCQPYLMQTSVHMHTAMSQYTLPSTNIIIQSCRCTVPVCVRVYSDFMAFDYWWWITSGCCCCLSRCRVVLHQKLKSTKDENCVQKSAAKRFCWHENVRRRILILKHIWVDYHINKFKV